MSVDDGWRYAKWTKVGPGPGKGPHPCYFCGLDVDLDGEFYVDDAALPIGRIAHVACHAKAADAAEVAAKEEK